MSERRYSPEFDRRRYDPALFTGTAPYYHEFRSGYPAAVFDYLVARFALGAETRVLDLGCGTGQLAIPLARRGVPVLALDPDRGMLLAGREAAAGTGRIDWVQGSSWELGGIRGPLRLVTMGRSFHWMDRPATLEALETMIDSVGGIALVASVHRHGPPTDSYGRAQQVITEVVAGLLGPERRAGTGSYGHPADRHEVALARSAFADVSVAHFPAPRRWSVDQLVGLTLSSSYASPALLGSRQPAFEEALRQRLERDAPAGGFEERDVVQVVIGVRR